MDNLEFLNNIDEPVCAFDGDKRFVFMNKSFKNSFNNFSSVEKFKKHFNFNLCFLSLENIKNKTPIDLLLQSKEDFHTSCTYQNNNEEYISYYIYTFNIGVYKVAVFKDITPIEKIASFQKKYNKLQVLYDDIKESSKKYEKLQEHAQTQVLKMGIINRISLVIRETNDMETILASALGEIHNLLGSFKTYFSMREKQMFKVSYSVLGNDIERDLLIEYELSVVQKIKNKEIIEGSCIREYLNSEQILSKGVRRIIIPVYNRSRLLGIIVTLTRQKFNFEENNEILQSISVQLSSSIIQAGLIQQLNKKNKKLEKALSELRDTQMQLINSEKMASIGQLVSGVAHEINTPLASISSNNKLVSKLLSNDAISKEQIDILKDLNSIDFEATNRISNIVKSLKRFVRLDEAEFQAADINSEIDLTLKLITHELKQNISVTKNYSSLPPVMCSVNMLNQVFMNLLVNACHSIPSEKKGEIVITTDIIDNNLIVKIKDNGCGMPDEVKSKIFNVGFTTKKIGIGTGLGLSISKKIVELHKGSISFDSNIGFGTEFTVVIPTNIKS